MDYKAILEDIKPTAEETREINEVASKIIDFLAETCRNEGIDAKIALVGSVAKSTALKGKSDIDVFMAFPLETDEERLKEMGLYLAHKCSDEVGERYFHHFASHPYVTSIIDGYEKTEASSSPLSTGQYFTPAMSRPIWPKARRTRFCF